VTVEGCEGGTGGGGGWSGCVNCVSGAWERVGAGRAVAASGTPASTQKLMYYSILCTSVNEHTQVLLMTSTIIIIS
jgi:hypothetical protein